MDGIGRGIREFLVKDLLVYIVLYGKLLLTRFCFQRCGRDLVWGDEFGPALPSFCRIVYFWRALPSFLQNCIFGDRGFAAIVKPGGTSSLLRTIVLFIECINLSLSWLELSGWSLGGEADLGLCGLFCW